MGMVTYNRDKFLLWGGVSRTDFWYMNLPLLYCRCGLASRLASAWPGLWAGIM